MARRLVYLYVGSDDVEADLAHHTGPLGGELVWRAEAYGTTVAAVRLGEGPLVLLAGHRPSPSVLPVWAVEDLAAERARLVASGWTGRERQVEVPDGPCLVLADPSGNEVGLLEQVRPGLLERRG